MGYIGNQSTGITYTNINTFRGKVANLTALNAVSGMENGDLYLTEYNNHAHMYTGTAWVDLGEITGPQGPVGPRGIAGASVSTVVRTTGDGSAGTTDVYTITYNDATTSTFEVYNGEDGAPGTINHIKRTVGTGAAGTTDTYTAYADVAETQLLGTFNVYNGYDGVASTVGSLVDVDLTTVPVEDGQTIIWNEASSKWIPGDAASTLDSLTDVDLITTPAVDGQTIIWDEIEGKWIPGDAGGITVEPELSTLSVTVNEGSSTSITISNYFDTITYGIDETNPAIATAVVTGNQLVITGSDVASDLSTTIKINAVAAGLAISDWVTVTVNVIYVPIMVDDTIQVVDFTNEASVNDGFNII